VQDRLRRGGDPPTFREQPGLEAGGTGDLHTREQLRPDVGKLHGLGPAAAGDDSHVDHHVPGQLEHDRVTLEHGMPGQGTPQLREAPAQRAERVVGLVEEQGRELGAGGRPVAEEQVGQHGPALAAADRVVGVRPAADPGPAQQVEGEAHLRPNVSCGAAGRGVSRDRRRRRGLRRAR